MNDNLTIHNGVMEGQCPDSDTNLDNEEVRHIDAWLTNPGLTLLQFN